MTTPDPNRPNLPAPIDDDLMVGMEDFDNTDMVMPRLKLDHTEGVMVDTLSNETFSELEVVLLGIIKQRILWPAEVGEDKTGPLCKSLNYTQGLPDRDRFPWKASGFKPAEYSEGPLPCEACQLKEWETHPQGGKPWCSELFVFPLMMGGDDNWSPALFTLQRSGIKSARAYMTAFKRAKLPLFTSRTKITLNQLRRGSVKYVVPQFVKGAPIDQDLWRDFADQFRLIREFVQTPRDETPVEEPRSPAASTKTAAATEDDEEVDW